MTALAGRRASWVPAADTTTRQLTSFMAIGLVSTAAYVVAYAALRTAMEPLFANAVALLVTAVGNTAANRRLTFAVRDGAGALRDQVGGLVALGVALAVTTVAVAALAALAPSAGRLAELALLVAANVAATICRFLLLRRWIAGPRRATPVDLSGVPA